MYDISIIIPIYNGEKYINRCINSILKQKNFNSLEIIMIDDGSSDNTLSLCNEIANTHNNIKVYHQNNGGVSSARNNGLRYATGEYIGFIDIDDTIDEDMYSVLINNARKYNAEISSVGYTVIKENSSFKFWDSGKIQEYIGEDRLKAFLSSSEFSGYIWDKIYKADKIKNISFDNKLTICEDKKYLYDCIKCSNKIVFEDVCKYNYMLNNVSAMTSPFNIKKMAMLDVVEQINKDICKEYPKLSELTNAEYLRTAIFLYRWIYKNSKTIQKYKTERKNLKKKIKSFKLGFAKSFLSKREFLEFLLIKAFSFMYRTVVALYFK